MFLFEYEFHTRIILGGDDSNGTVEVYKFEGKKANIDLEINHKVH